MVDDRKFIGIDPDYHRMLVEISEYDNRPYKREVEHLISERHKEVERVKKAEQTIADHETKRAELSERPKESGNILDSLRG